MPIADHFLPCLLTSTASKKEPLRGGRPRLCWPVREQQERELDFIQRGFLGLETSFFFFFFLAIHHGHKQQRGADPGLGSASRSQPPAAGGKEPGLRPPGHRLWTDGQTASNLVLALSYIGAPCSASTCGAETQGLGHRCFPCRPGRRPFSPGGNLKKGSEKNLKGSRRGDV